MFLQCWCFYWFCHLVYILVFFRLLYSMSYCESVIPCHYEYVTPQHGRIEILDVFSDSHRKSADVQSSSSSSSSSAKVPLSAPRSSWMSAWHSTQSFTFCSSQIFPHISNSSCLGYIFLFCFSILSPILF